MIVPMARVRMLGPRDGIGAAIQELQDVGTLHVVEPEVEHRLLSPASLLPRQQRELRYVHLALEDTERAIALLRATEPPGSLAPDSGLELARWARRVRRLRLRAEALDAEETRLEEERALIEKYREIYSAFLALFEAGPERAGTHTYSLVLKDARATVLERLRQSLRGIAGDELEMKVKTLGSGEAAILLSIPSAKAAPVEEVFSRAGLAEVPLPPSYGGASLAEVVPRMLSRFGDIPAELEGIRVERARLMKRQGDELFAARAALHDRSIRLQTHPRARLSPHAFVLEGWVPADQRAALESRLAKLFEDALAVEELEPASLPGGGAPVALANPRLFRPFEALVRFLPLPRYGTIDPTPYLAVFFPMFFGLILGDIGYGAVLGLLAWAVARRARPESISSSLAKVAGACAVFSILFGLLYGELFGDFGHRALGLPSLWFRREEALLPFLGLSLALGFVHILLGLVLGFLGALRGGKREAFGRGVAAGMIVLILLAILAATEVLPGSFFTPIVVALLVSFAALVVAEGVLAPLELLTAVSNIFSYARIMAIGTASVMMAVVANRMAGAVGSVGVGALFALTFHLVNFVLGVFSPTIHGLRLHYVEFFGKFYRPGGAGYEPLRHWAPGAGTQAK
jgi:V/A-type H+-transporting ATPase subunit I